MAEPALAGHQISSEADVEAASGQLGRETAGRGLEFDALYEAHFDLAWRTLSRYGVPAPQLDDALQDVFLVVHQHLSGFEGRSSIKTWIFGIARRVARNHRNVRARPEDPQTIDGVAHPSVGPERVCEQREGLKLLDRLLLALPEDKREAFVLVEIEQMTTGEAAQALGINVNTLQYRLRAARQELEQALARRAAHERWRQPWATGERS